jgi:hypothetical protein
MLVGVLSICIIKTNTMLENRAEPLPIIVAMFEYLRNNAALMRAVLGPKGNLAFQTQIRLYFRVIFI